MPRALIPILASILLSPRPVPAADDRVPVAVMEFTSKGGVAQAQMDSLGDLLADAIRDRKRYRVIGKNDIAALLRLEEKKILMGCDDESCIAEIGGALGVRWVVVGNLGRFGQAYLLNIKIMDAQEVVVAASVSRKIEGGQEAFIDVIPEAVDELFGEVGDALSGGAVGAAASGAGLDVTATTEGSPVEPYTKWGHVAFWTGLGVVAAGAAFHGLAAQAGDDYRSGDMGAWSKSQTLAGIGWAGLGVGVGLMATGAALWLLAPDEGGDEPGPKASVGPTPLPGGLGLGVAGRW